MKKQGISILTSTYNGALRLEKTLKAISMLNTGGIPYVEVILVDNASTDNTIHISKAIWDKLGTPFPMLFLEEKTPGKLYAQETGLKQVKGEFVIICDDDNALFPDYLQIGYNYFIQNPSIGVLGGRGIGASTIEFPEWFEQYSYYYGCAPQAPQTGDVRPTRNVVYGAGMWFRFEAYLKVKEVGYDFILTGRTGKKLIAGEDSELCWIIRYLNYDIWYIDEMKFHHHITENRLTEAYRKKLIIGMTESGLNGSLHNRIWNGGIREKVRFFWFKELMYACLYFVKIPFNSSNKDKLFDLKRTGNNIKVLLQERADYDKKVNQIVAYYQKCKRLSIK